MYLGGREHPLAELLRALAPDWQDLCVGLPEGTTFDERRTIEVKRPMTAFLDEDAGREWLADAINRFVNEIRPRAAALAGTE